MNETKRYTPTTPISSTIIQNHVAIPQVYANLH